MGNLKAREAAEKIFEEYQFPYAYVDANGWTVFEERTFSREVFLQTAEKEDSTCYKFTVEFYQNTDRIKRIELLNKE